MRRLVAVLSSAAIAAGVLMGVPSPANAANVGTVTVTGGGTPSVSPTVITGAVGDTFTIAYSGLGAPVVLDVIGSAVSLSGSDCSSISCSVSDGVPKDFTIESAGSVVLDESGSVLATLTIVIGGSRSGTTDPALVYPTGYLNANGGTCPGAVMQVTKTPGTVGWLSLPSGSTCTRTGYTLLGWARSSDATTSEFSAYLVVPIRDESFTLYAVWVPTDTLITYDANVGADAACIDAAGANVPAGEGRTVTALNPETLASSAPCVPDNDQLELAGWATFGGGPVYYALGAPEAFDIGSRHTLYAVWQPTFTSVCGQGEDLRTEFLAYSCLDFGDVPVGWRSILEVRITNVSDRIVGETVYPFSDTTETSNGILERVRLRDPAECNPGTGALSPGDSCLVRYAWTPERSGPVGPITLRVCLSAVETCYRTPDGKGLRGNAYMSQPEPESPTSTPAEQPEEVTPSLAIEGERGEVKGKPGVIVKGDATGFEPGTVLVTWLRFPGQTGYYKGTARPEVQADGTFTWQRKTGKRISVYFTSEDGAVQSNRVVILGA